MNLKERIEAARVKAELTIWEIVVSEFPEIQTGDFSPEDSFALDTALEKAITAWYEGNIPAINPYLLLYCKHCKVVSCTPVELGLTLFVFEFLQIATNLHCTCSIAMARDSSVAELEDALVESYLHGFYEVK